MNHRITTRVALAGLASVLAVALSSCQEVDQPNTTLTQKQWQEVKQHILDEKPNPEYPIGAQYADKIKLIGFDVSPALVAGKPATFTWYWQALDDIDENWRVFVHFDSSEKAYRQNLGHHPVDELYQTGRWEKGQIIEDIQKVTIDPNYPPGQAVPRIGFYKGKQRLPIKNDVKKTDDRRVIGPPLTVKPAAKKAGSKKADALPTYAVTKLDDDAISKASIDGKLDEAFWDNADPIKLAGFGAAPDLGTEVYVVRGTHDLLVGARLPDERIWSTMDIRDDDTWTEEVFELYIDGNRDGKHYLEMQINPLATIFDAHYVQRLGRGKGSRDDQIDTASAWNMKGLTKAVAIDGTVNDDSDKDSAWTVELKLPFDEIPGVSGAPKSGEHWAANFYRYDRPDDKRTYAYAWSKPKGGSFHQVERFGTLAFGAADGQPDDPSAAKKATIKRINAAKIKPLRKKMQLRQIKKRPKSKPAANQPAPKQEASK